MELKEEKKRVTVENSGSSDAYHQVVELGAPITKDAEYLTGMTREEIESARADFLKNQK